MTNLSKMSYSAASQRAKRASSVDFLTRSGVTLSSAKPGAVIHRNVAVIACDTPGTLQETLQRLGDLQVDAVQVGERHLILPSQYVHLVLDRLKEHGQFPRLVGQTRDRDDAAASEEGGEEQA